MKLIVMIPAYNEQERIAEVIKEIPRFFQEIDTVEVLVINDGSTDNTAVRAEDGGADYIITNSINMGLAMTFRRGLEECLRLGADVIVNTDADFQYNQKEIGKLINPILYDGAGMVIGDRQVKYLHHMKILNKYGNILGSFILRTLTGFHIIDASSGFRAFSRDTALKLNIFFGHTYTHQTIIEAVYKKIKIAQVPIEFRKRENTRSRLIKNIFTHIRVSIIVIVRTILIYKPLKTFLVMGLTSFALGVILGIRFLYYYFIIEEATGKIQSLILASVLILFGTIMVILGFLADLISINRKLSEDILYKLKKLEYTKHKE